jgi:uncharacterized protein (DUF58 family)
MIRLKDIIPLRRDAEDAASHIPALAIKTYEMAENLIHGFHNRRRPGTGEKFWQFRDYFPGDRPQDIDWRQSARTDRVFIREKERQSTRKTWLWCASGPGMDYRSPRAHSSKREAARLLTLALAILLTRAEEQIGTYGDTRTGRSEEKLQDFTNDLLSVKHESLPPSQTYTPSPNSSVILVGDFLSSQEEISDCFQRLSSTVRTAIIVQVLDPSELDLDFRGRVIFEEFEGAARQSVQDAQSVRLAYRNRINQHLDFLRDTCEHRNWDYVLHSTGNPPGDVLRDLWLRIDRRAEGFS